MSGFFGIAKILDMFWKEWKLYVPNYSSFVVTFTQKCLTVANVNELLPHDLYRAASFSLNLLTGILETSVWKK